MKKLIINTFIPLIISAIFGFFSARFVFNIYRENINERFSSSRIYLIQNGEYNSYEEMRKNNLGTSYVYYEDDNKYKSIVGITKEENNISKIKDLYDNNLTVEEYYINSDLLNNKQTDYDEQLLKTNNQKEVQDIINNIINLYKEDETIRLILTK